MIAKIYLALVALIYIGLAIWCSISPAKTSEKVGFELKGGSGQSEFMTVYGGLEFALGLLLLLSIFRDQTVWYGLFACVTIHASLVVFRTISLLVYSGFEPFTYRLAAGEWIITGIGILLMWLDSRNG